MTDDGVGDAPQQNPTDGPEPPCSPRRAQSDWCVSHDPNRKEARRRAASKAARSKPNPEIRALRKQAASLYESVLSGAVEPGVAAVACQVANLQARLVELERKIREADEFESRIAQLEERAR